MSKPIARFFRRLLLGETGNLVSLSDPYRELARLLRGKTVKGILDAGASNGRISRKLLRYFPRATAYAFEANPAYTEILKRAAAEDPRIHPVMLALADARGNLELNVAASPGVTSFFKPTDRLRRLHPRESEIRATEQVETIPLDEWLAENGAPGIELMKFDIQGAELHAMKGAENTLKKSTLTVYTEVFFNPMYEGGAIFSQIDLFLRSCGFVFYNLYKVRADPKNMLDQANAIYIKPELLGPD